MKSIFQITLLFVLLFFINSCDSRQSKENEADARLKQIEQLISNSEYNAAKIMIDSVHVLYPLLVEKRKIAAALEDTIIRRESSRTLAYCDSLLPVKIREAEAIKSNFRFEKNPKYQQFGNFIFKTQQTESNSNRIYLKTFVDENSDFYLVSNYCGGKLEHILVEVSINELFAKTDTINISNAAYHSFSDGEMRYETVTFKNEEDNGVSGFIAQNQNMQIKVTLHGKRNYSYNLSGSDKKAIVETYRLWVVMKDIMQLQNEIKKAKNKILRINNR
ncbi:MAG: hypothetical protein ACOYMD_01075 [Paludibacter sp.]